MNMNQPSGRSASSATHGGYGNVGAGAYALDYRHVTPVPDDRSALAEYEDREDLDVLIALGLHMSD